MKILKRIIYTLLGMLLAGTAALVGVILYAEYSGNHFTPNSKSALAQADFSEDESRLAYDENDNIMELPQTQPAADTSTENSPVLSSPSITDSPAENITDSTAQIPADSQTSGTDAPAGSSSIDEVAAWNPAAASSYSSSDTGSEPELNYVMDLGSALFHTPDCAYAANIADEKRSEMTTTSTKIMNAGYNACPHCHPDQVAAAAAKLANTTASDIGISNELGQ